jgi:hypothetical protein
MDLAISSFILPRSSPNNNIFSSCAGSDTSCLLGGDR